MRCTVQWSTESSNAGRLTLLIEVFLISLTSPHPETAPQPSERFLQSWIISADTTCPTAMFSLRLPAMRSTRTTMGSCVAVSRMEGRRSSSASSARRTEATPSILFPMKYLRVLCSEGMHHCLSFRSKSGRITMKNRSEKSWAGRFVPCSLRIGGTCQQRIAFSSRSPLYTYRRNASHGYLDSDVHQYLCFWKLLVIFDAAFMKGNVSL
jgi:hypothetical protein